MVYLLGGMKFSGPPGEHRGLSYYNFGSMHWATPVEGEKTGDGISYASHVKNPNPLKARATTFYDPVHNALDKEAQCAWKEGEESHWPSVYIQKPFITP
jgi:hypothetical protein